VRINMNRPMTHEARSKIAKLAAMAVIRESFTSQLFSLLANHDLNVG
jgi:hypothetical protein